MNKKEFINYLESRLSVLNKAERDDLINEYVQHIENKLAEGLSEKEAVETLGNVEDMVREILSAYNVDPDYGNKEESELNNVVTGISGVFNRFIDFIRNIGDYIMGQRASNILTFVLKAIVIFFVLWICFVIGKFVFCDIIAYMIGQILGMGRIFGKIAEVLYVVVAFPTVCYIFIRFVKYNICGIKESIVYATENVNEERGENITEENTKENVEKNLDKKEAPKLNINKIKPVKVREKRERTVNFDFGHFIKSIIMFAVKCFVIMCLIPCLFTLVFTIIAFGGLIVMAMAGYPLLGVSVACLGFNLVGISIVAIIIKFIFIDNMGVAK